MLVRLWVEEVTRQRPGRSVLRDVDQALHWFVNVGQDLHGVGP